MASAAAPPSPGDPSPYGAAGRGDALDVVVVRPPRSGRSGGPRDGGGGTSPPSSGGLHASSDFHVAFPSSLASSARGSLRSLATAVRSASGALQQAGGRSPSSGGGGRKRGSRNGSRSGSRNGSESSDRSAGGDSETGRDGGDRSPPQSAGRVRGRQTGPPPRRGMANVAVSINGRPVPELDMVFSKRGGSRPPSSGWFGVGSGGGGDEDATCRFVRGGCVRPPVDVLSMLTEGEVAPREDEGRGEGCNGYNGSAAGDGPRRLCQDPTGRERPVLSPGRNLLRYTLLSSRDGRALATAEAHLYLWDADDSVVVSDVDGTVTRSDVRGVLDTVVTSTFEHLHDGVCGFYDRLSKLGREGGGGEEGIEVAVPSGSGGESESKKNRGEVLSDGTRGEIRFLYLSSRPIALVAQTRKLLTTCRQGGASLPSGPIMCHTGQLSAVLYSELFAKDIYKFKADVLTRQVLVPFAAARGAGDDAALDDVASGSIMTSSIMTSSIMEDSITDSADDVFRDRSDVSALSDGFGGRDPSRSAGRRARPGGDVIAAAFGNKATDRRAYEMAGVDPRDIYIIDRDSRILCEGGGGDDGGAAAGPASRSDGRATAAHLQSRRSSVEDEDWQAPARGRPSRPRDDGGDDGDRPILPDVCCGAAPAASPRGDVPRGATRSLPPGGAAVPDASAVAALSSSATSSVTSSSSAAGGRPGSRTSRPGTARLSRIQLRSLSAPGSRGGEARAPPGLEFDGYGDPRLLRRFRSRLS